MADDSSDDEGPTPSKIPRVSKSKDQQKRLIVILERASLETVKNGKNFELLNCDDHKHIMKKHDKNPADYRPDITHQCLLMLMDSPLNRAGLLQVYIHTERNVLIEINPQTRIPRTFNRFCGLMVQLLHKLSIHASNGPIKLMKVIKNPITDHLPVGCKKYVTSYKAKKCIKLREFDPPEEPIVFVVGAFAHGKIDITYGEEDVAISEYPLSAALTCTKVCSAFEESWGIT
ncbi:ribosomal RNA small subunit methyltransferase NEP1-like [Hydractinia symbiolongicarpus]|uniref:ribosomal RNA small subunit methyltransferase NEP1-like n=1 Tax=Hydractinia symbiolongicarpus TaxID=13093 RepID=UPI0025506AC6|nr:ribosomal RNA small subunit methyltransferase NEP1-like [Hydractinia symbiolongicarpus]